MGNIKLLREFEIPDVDDMELEWKYGFTKKKVRLSL